jgi:1-acyl-sn-glycerol-3-phosphate acyltransferase
MVRERKVQDYDPVYSFLRHYVDLALKLSYRTIKYVGRERLPKDGAIIFAPNHTNALMDAMVILAMDHGPKVYVARADIFRDARIAKVLKFLKIMPIMRMRDGMEEVRKNNETIERAVDVLRDKVPFCIFPEGTHQAKYSSLPLSKGIFRIAFQAQELMPDMPLYIVPVGLRYGNFFRFRSTVRVQIGEPINVGKFVAENSEYTQAEQMNMLKDLLDERMKKSIFYIPNDENYDAVYEICAAVVKTRVRGFRSDAKLRKLRGLDAHFEANNMTVRHLDELKQNDPERYAELIALGHRASQLRRSRRISLSSVSVKHNIFSRVLRILIFILLLPYSLPASLLTLPISGVCQLLFRKMEDYAFRNSVRYVINLVMWPILMVIYAIIAYAVLPWKVALIITLAALPAPIVAQEIYRLMRIFKSDIKLFRFAELRDCYTQIREKMFTK